MHRIALLLIAASALPAHAQVLIAADELPAMEVLAARLKAGAGVPVNVVRQSELPASLAAFKTLVVYVHRDLDPALEHAAIEFANDGGKLVLLHHSISSAKRKNREWLPFLGVALAEGDVGQGGYKWIEGITWELVNLAPADPITARGVSYPAKEKYRGTERPAIVLQDSEVYLNHHLTGPRTLLLGVKFRDPKSGVTWEQDTGGWYRPAGRGRVMYFMAGHSAREFENPAYAQILVNAVGARPR